MCVATELQTRFLSEMKQSYSVGAETDSTRTQAAGPEPGGFGVVWILMASRGNGLFPSRHWRCPTGGPVSAGLRFLSNFFSATTVFGGRCSCATTVFELL